MGNMSYCRFENTFNDLDDCYTALGEKTFDELSDTEKKYAQRLIRMCRNIADDFMGEVEDIELSKNSQVPQCVQTDVICCDFFKQSIKEYGWFKLDHLGEEQYLMPHILGTKIKINYCPNCGKECKDTILSADFYHSI